MSRKELDLAGPGIGNYDELEGVLPTGYRSLLDPKQTQRAITLVKERIEERTDQRLEEGDHERFSHYVPKAKLTEAMVMGTPVIALCGKVWVPSRNPDRFPVCPECKEIWESLRPGEGEG